jgi:hypothetical protein
MRYRIAPRPIAIRGGRPVRGPYDRAPWDISGRLHQPRVLLPYLGGAATADANSWQDQQQVVYSDPMSGQVLSSEPGSDVSADDARNFADLWTKFTGLWPAFLALQGEISDHRDQWAQLARAAYDAGDIESFRAYSYNGTKLDELEGERAKAEATVNKYRDHWDALKTYLANLGRWFGLQGYSTTRLGLPPLVLAVGLVAVISALAYVVNTYMRVRADLDFDAQLLEQVRNGQVSATDAAAILKSRPPAAGTPDKPGLPSLGSIAGLLLVGGAVVLFGPTLLEAALRPRRGKSRR